MESAQESALLRDLSQSEEHSEIKPPLMAIQLFFTFAFEATNIQESRRRTWFNTITTRGRKGCFFRNKPHYWQGRIIWDIFFKSEIDRTSQWIEKYFDFVILINSKWQAGCSVSRHFIAFITIPIIHFFASIQCNHVPFGKGITLSCLLGKKVN